MREEHLVYLACPECAGGLLLAKGSPRGSGVVEEGTLACKQCPARYPIIGCIPRFVGPQNYAESFGLEWNAHAKTQYDSHSGLPLSERRFFEETRWPRQLVGEVLLEVGSGSGRFTEQAATTGAMVVSMDYSSAVEANYRANGDRAKVLIVQANIFQMPFGRARFDKVLCIGVLQHTPDPKRAFLSLLPFLKPGGNVVIDIYKKVRGTYLWSANAPKYWVRPMTKRIPPRLLYELLRRYVDVMWPLATLLRRIPRVGVSLNWRLLLADYSKEGLTGKMLKEWAYLNTFDRLSPRYDYPQTIDTVRNWFAESGLMEAEVSFGHNGIEARGTAPKAVNREVVGEQAILRASAQ